VTDTGRIATGSPISTLVFVDHIVSGYTGHEAA